MTEQTSGISEKPVQPEIISEIRPQENPFKVVLLMVLGLLIVAGAVYAGITIGKKQSPPEVIPQVTEVSPTPDETANWKTYTNTKYGYTIKYPENLFNKDLGAGNSYLDNVVFASKSLDTSKLGDLYQKDYGNYFVVSVANEPNIEKRLKLIVQDRKEVQVDGLLGVKLNNNIVFVTRNNRTYVFDNSVYGKSINSTIINQILSTFKFTDQKTDETANWKTFKESKLSYSIKYPPDWVLNESESDGYPYIGLIDPIAQKMAPSQTEIDRGAMIEIYVAPWLGKDKSLSSLKKSLTFTEEMALSQEQETPTRIEERTIGQITGVQKSFSTEKVSGETFAFFRENEGKSLVFRITLTVFNSTDQAQPLTSSYLTVFNQVINMLASTLPR